LRRFHRLVGLLGLGAFLATGIYMLKGFPALHAGNDAIRFQYRANHVYVLLASLVNVALGLFPAGLAEVAVLRRWRVVLQEIGAAMTLVAPALLVFAFFVEPDRGSPQRILTTGGIALLLGGILLQLPARRR
jgi:hypothetical protein